MNTEISEIDSEAAEAPGKESKSRRGGAALAWLALLLALAALGGTGWLWWQEQQAADPEMQQLSSKVSKLQDSQQGLESGLQRVENEVAALPEDSASAITALEQRFEARADELERLRAELDEQVALARSLQMASAAMQGRVQAAEAALANLANRQRSAVSDLDVAEVEYLLRLASERLKLFSDVSAAESALELAGRQLAALDNPAYLAVRQDIAAARRDLENFPAPDVFETSNELDAAQRSVAALNFPAGGTAVPEAEAAGPGWWGKVKEVFSKLVTIRRSTTAEMEQLTLQERDFIRQRLWLQLETARLALMRLDESAFRKALSGAQDTLAGWFDDEGKAYTDLASRLQKLQGIALEPVLPDISQPWQTLQALRQGSNGYVPLGAGPAAQNAADSVSGSANDPRTPVGTSQQMVQETEMEPDTEEDSEQE